MTADGHWAGVDLRALAAEHGTPLYLLDLDRVRRQYGRLRAFDRVRYAQKANGCLHLLRQLHLAGATVDAVSAGELQRALLAGLDPEHIEVTADLFDGPTLEAMLACGARPNVGSMDALETLASAGYRGEVTLRINPGFGHGHDRKVTTGGERSKHGIWHPALPEALRRAAAAGLQVTGLHQHIGSGADRSHLERQIQAMGEFLRAAPPSVTRVSAGGGLPVPYRTEDPEFDVDAYASAWLTAKQDWCQELGRELTLEVEPGRYLVAQAGLLLTQVHATKRTEELHWALLDAGFHTLARPMLYGAYHRASLVGPGRGPEGARQPYVLAGPLCEASDVLTQDSAGRPEPQQLPILGPGDLLALHDVGAYGASMSSNYNGFPLPAEVVVAGGQARLARRRQSVDEWLAPELDCFP